MSRQRADPTNPKGTEPSRDRHVDADSRRAGHEPIDASVKGLAVFAACFVVGLAGLMGGAYWLYAAVTPDRPARGLTVRPPEPNLQPSPGDANVDWQDLQRLNSEYHREFADRGWVAPDGSVRVPDAIAAKVIAESNGDGDGRRRRRWTMSLSIGWCRAASRAVLALVLALSPAPALGQSAPPAVGPQPTVPGILGEVGIDQNLGAAVPLDAPFDDEFGRTTTLRAVLGGPRGDRPAVLVLNYFTCPQLCSLVLNDLSRTLKVMETSVGKDFDVVAVSFDPRDTAELARKKRDNYAAEYERATGRTGTTRGWRFLTGHEPSVEALCRAVGFRYRWDEKQQQFAHAAGVIVLTPGGRVSRYFYGIDYRPNDLRLALSNAAGEKLSSPVERVLLYCFAYDPSTGRYSLAIWRLVNAAAVVTAFGVGVLILALLWRERRQKSRGGPGDGGSGKAVPA